MDIRFTVDLQGVEKHLNEIERRQVPYATALTLTRLAQLGQKAVRATLPEIFHLRNDWTIRNIRITPAKRGDIRAGSAVRTATENRKTGAPDYMPQQEYGNIKMAHGGRRHICIPSDYLRELTHNGPIRAAMRPHALLQATEDAYAGRGRAGRRQSSPQTPTGWICWIPKGSQTVILGRRCNDRTEQTHVLYILVDEAVVHARLGMEGTVAEEVSQSVDEVWADAWKEIYLKGLKI